MDELPAEPVVSVVLCTYDPDMYEHFRDAAASVLEQDYENVELVVVVDGSTEMFEMVEREYGGREDVRLHLNDSNVGLLESRNTGADIANGDIVAFIDDDAVADVRWIEELVSSYLERNALAAGGKMTPSWVGGQPRFLPEEFYWLVGVTHRGFADGPGVVRNTFGSNLSFRRDVFEELGGFNPEIGGRKGERNLQGGETELCARLQQLYGSNLWYNPDAVVEHKVFEYRTDLFWLVKRAFWQGYSKRVMATLVPDSEDEESRFLRKLIVEFVPHRIGRLLRRPTTTAAAQLAGLIIFTGAVGAGYACGTLAD